MSFSMLARVFLHKCEILYPCCHRTLPYDSLSFSVPPCGNNFCVDTVRKNKTGLGGAYNNWTASGEITLRDNDMVHLRWGEVVFIRRKYSREVLLLSTALIFEENKEPVYYK